MYWELIESAYHDISHIVNLAAGRLYENAEPLIVAGLRRYDQITKRIGYGNLIHFTGVNFLVHTGRFGCFYFNPSSRILNIQLFTNFSYKIENLRFSYSYTYYNKLFLRNFYEFKLTYHLVKNERFNLEVNLGYSKFNLLNEGRSKYGLKNTIPKVIGGNVNRIYDRIDNDTPPLHTGYIEPNQINDQ